MKRADEIQYVKLPTFPSQQAQLAKEDSKGESVICGSRCASAFCRRLSLGARAVRSAANKNRGLRYAVNE